MRRFLLVVLALALAGGVEAQGPIKEIPSAGGSGTIGPGTATTCSASSAIWVDASSVIVCNGPLPVPQGGTGVGTFNAYGVITGGTSSTGALQSVSPGTSTHVLTSNGAAALPTFQVIPAPTATAISTATTCIDAGASDTYACNLPVAPTIAAGFCATFNANTANIGASSINFNATGAVAIKRKTPTITSDTATGDIRADAWVTVCHDGTNFQMQSPSGLAFNLLDQTNCTAGSLVRITPGATTINCDNNIGYGVNSTNQLRNIGLNLSAGTATLSINSEYRSAWHSYLLTNAMVVALGPVTTGNVSAFTLPAKMAVENMYVVITGSAAGPATVTISCGRTGAAYVDLITANDAKAAANTIYGNDAAERGALLGFDLPSYTGTTVVNCQFVSGGANLDTVTGFSATVIVKAALVI